MNPWLIGMAVELTLFAAAEIVLCILAYRKGKRDGAKDSTERLARYETLLARAGIRLEEDLPERLREVEDASRSWTGQYIHDEYRPVPGSIPRWDEPSHK